LPLAPFNFNCSGLKPLGFEAKQIVSILTICDSTLGVPYLQQPPLSYAGAIPDSDRAKSPSLDRLPTLRTNCERPSLSFVPKRNCTQEVGGDAEYRKALRHVLLEAERTSTLVEELLSLARADSGRESLHLTLIDLRDVITEIANEWYSLLEARNLRFTQEFADCELPVLADRSAGQRLLVKRENMAVITVRDSRIGIAESEQSKIFERFYRVDKARSRELGGAGIGLAIAGWIVQQRRGSLTVQSCQGKESSFYVAFPVQSASPALDQASKSAISATGT
jgi:signal transduction histidine kinase